MMSRIKTTDRSKLKGKNRAVEKKIIIGSLIFFVLIVIVGCFQTSDIKVFGTVPNMLLSLVLSIGFLFGEREGGAAGIFAGFIYDCMGGTGFLITPIAFLMLGYVCGILSKWFLSQNFPSFVLYTLIFGAANEALTFFYYLLLSKDFSIFNTIFKVLLPEYISFVIFAPIMYLLSFCVKGLLMRDGKRKDK